MNKHDEPVLGGRPVNDRNHPENTNTLETQIKRLVNGQLYGVLCTQGDGQPYGSLVAYSFSDDMTRAVFATPVATRKYKLLAECERVSIVIDNRPDHTDDMMQVEAITATGRATEVIEPDRCRMCADMLLARHSYLKSFVAADSSTLFEIKITRYLHVTRFQEVNQWVPAQS
jgi:nitroimidazol reductase NimA-like FMN-containing flavoprotein (pyridoxamine 5'-phosphate oxidase superfamily)